MDVSIIMALLFGVRIRPPGFGITHMGESNISGCTVTGARV